MAWLRRFFVGARAWQVFVYLLAVDFVLDVGVSEWLSATFGQSMPHDLVGRLVTGIALVIQTSLSIAWYWFVGIFLLDVAASDRPRDRMLFRFAAGYSLLYAWIVPWSFSSTGYAWTIVLPLHLMAMGCLLYMCKVIAKLVTVVQTKKWKPFREYAGTFLLALFLPVGIWFLQPKINATWVKRRDA